MSGPEPLPGRLVWSILGGLALLVAIGVTHVVGDGILDRPSRIEGGIPRPPDPLAPAGTWGAFPGEGDDLVYLYLELEDDGSGHVVLVDGDADGIGGRPVTWTMDRWVLTVRPAHPVPRIEGFFFDDGVVWAAVIESGRRRFVALTRIDDLEALEPPAADLARRGRQHAVSLR